MLLFAVILYIAIWFALKYKLAKYSKVKAVFAWFDVWIGAFYDKDKKKLYIFLLPMLGVVINLTDESNS